MNTALRSFRKASVLLVSSCLLAIGSSAYAASTWNVDLCGTDNNASTTNPAIGTSTVGGYLQSTTGEGCTQGTNVGTNSVRAYAYAVTNSPTTSTFAAATLAQYGASYGLGVQSGTESIGSAPEHTMDNNGKTELIVFKFDEAIILDSVKLGWTQSDADITVMAYTGAGAPTITGKQIGNLATGWAMVQGYGDPAPDTTSTASGSDKSVAVNAGGVSSSWWIISAYNAGYGGAITNGDTLIDYVKVMTLSSRDPTTPPHRTPEPGSMALMGIAVAGFVATRRRSPKAVV